MRRLTSTILNATRGMYDMPGRVVMLQALKKVNEEDFFARFTYVVSCTVCRQRGANGVHACIPSHPIPLRSCVV